MLTLIKRNLLYTIRDTVGFLLSFLSIAILIIVYKAFLGNFQIDALKSASHLTSITSDGRAMVNYWLIGGLMVVTSITSVLGALGVIVDDHVLGKQQDFRISGTSPKKVFASYYISAICLGLLITMLCLILDIIIFIGFSGLTSLSVTQWLRLLGFALLGNLFGVFLFMPIVVFLKSRSGFNSLSTIVGTLIGFIAGIYISIGNVSSSIQNFMLSTPLLHLVALVKKVLMLRDERSFFARFPRVVGEQAREHYDKLYGNQLIIPNTTDSITSQQSFLFILLWIIGLAIINIIVLHYITKER